MMHRTQITIDVATQETAAKLADWYGRPASFSNLARRAFRLLVEHIETIETVEDELAERREFVRFIAAPPRGPRSREDRR